MNQSPNQLFSVEGKTIVITGGTGILGSVMAKNMAAAGAHVVVLGRREDAGKGLVNDIEKTGGKASFFKTDVLDKDNLLGVKKDILKTTGQIDVLVNAAGGNMPGATISPDKTFFDLDTKAFQQVVDLNLLGTVLPSQIFGEVMAANKKGIIVNISSMSAFRPITRVVGYSAAKAAIDNFTQWLAVEMAKKVGEGIRVNAIAPGFFLTEQNRALLTNPDGTLTARGNAVINQTPFGRFGDAEELIGTLLWLCSDASKFVTGVVVPVDGGFNAYCGV
ncbi:SDR family oxidoreductase [Imperialibacter roseus]|uniref:SDR family oxidoreductase n=1 Tax=Imperialibacter roseus TaxID=1324217 RepID=A0ABZ0IXD8_9BACT|nr:SDR family oxidoreductase [Imperialibacter roseus]WOK08287.1 SDR family oxidoreductase [Imperialibacter roseus]|tara:strand:- start:1650 stop:2477 length:828 start_codon:yes stop_codon:yes gene_type:complete